METKLDQQTVIRKYNSFAHLTEGYKRNSTVNLRIALMGSPGSGKSTLSSGLLYFSKLFLFKVDAVPEVAKWHYYKGTDFSQPEFELKKYDEQRSLEDIYPKELEILICEAPLIISAVYSAFYLGDDHPVSQEIFQRAEREKDRYTHFIVSRKLVKFEKYGRNESESQAEALHNKTLQILEQMGINYAVLNRYDEHIPLQVLSMVGAIRQDRSETEH